MRAGPGHGADEADAEPKVVPAMRRQKFLDFRYWAMNSRSVLYADTLVEFMAICGASALGTEPLRTRLQASFKSESTSFCVPVRTSQSPSRSSKLRCHRLSLVGKVGLDRAHNHANGLFCFPAHTVRACGATIQTHCVQALAWPLLESRRLGTARRELLSTRATIINISADGIGAFDHVSRAAMFEGLHRDSRLATLFPFVRQLYGQDSS